MAYTTINKSSDYFKTLLYTGNGSDAHSITGVGFKPDFVWTKNRGSATDHYVHDIVRGVEKAIRTNVTSGTYDTSINLQSFDSDGFTVGTQDGLNKSGKDIVSWNWLAGGSQGSSNTDGTINTTYTSVNTTSGFSICQWEGTGANATIGHGLGAVPKMYIVKNLDATNDWNVYHHTIGNTHRLFLNTTQAKEDNASAWNDTSPTSSVFSVGTNTNVNQSGSTMIAYVFAEKQGFSKFGSYTGNGNADGPFLFCGFKPSFLLLKNASDGAKNWEMLDNRRPSSGQNPADDILFPDTSDAESHSQTDRLLDFVSNGIKIRGNSAQMNGSGNTFIYMAFAEAPLVGSNNVPATAR